MFGFYKRNANTVYVFRNPAGSQSVINVALSILY